MMRYGHERHEKHDSKRLKRKVERLEKQMQDLKAQMRKAGLVARVEAIESVLGMGNW